MKYRTVIYTTIRAEIHHNDEFAGKADALGRIMEADVLDYSNVLGSSDLYDTIRVTEVEVVADEVHDYNLTADEEYADE
jgi:hypothetical protein